MQNKDDNVGDKTANKQERQREKREQERKIAIDSQKRSKFWLLHMHEKQKSCLRWLDWIFLGRYLPSLSLNYVGMSKDIEKRLPQLYYIKMKISCDLGFIAIRVAMAT